METLKRQIQESVTTNCMCGKKGDQTIGYCEMTKKCLNEQRKLT